MHLTLRCRLSGRGAEMKKEIEKYNKKPGCLLQSGRKEGVNMADKKPYYITTAIAYSSGKPHIGNTYEAVLADAIARFKRAEGYDVVFQTGTEASSGRSGI